jgi:lipoprotein-anchoring transpeptidase ErfK/SrfK
VLEAIASVVISLSQQKLFVYNYQDQLIYAAPVSTGTASTPTPVGQYEIGHKYERTDLVGDDYRINLPYVQCLVGEGINPDRYCLHPTPESEEQLGTPRSHGCIRTSLATARWLFLRTNVSTPVFIQ